jgi:hypothetical protein
VPAAAVIPAPIAYIKVVAVKKLVVGLCVVCCVGWARKGLPGRAQHNLPGGLAVPLTGCGQHGIRDLYFEKIRVFKAGLRLE